MYSFSIVSLTSSLPELILFIILNGLVVKIYGLAGSETSATTAIYDIKAPDVAKRAPASVPEVSSETVVDQAVPVDMNTIPTTPQYKESEKLIEHLNKL